MGTPAAMQLPSDDEAGPAIQVTPHLMSLTHRKCLGDPVATPARNEVSVRRLVSVTILGSSLQICFYFGTCVFAREPEHGVMAQDS